MWYKSSFATTMIIWYPSFSTQFSRFSLKSSKMLNGSLRWTIVMKKKKNRTIQTWSIRFKSLISRCLRFPLRLRLLQTLSFKIAIQKNTKQNQRVISRQGEKRERRNSTLHIGKLHKNAFHECTSMEDKNFLYDIDSTVQEDEHRNLCTRLESVPFSYLLEIFLVLIQIWERKLWETNLFL